MKYQENFRDAFTGPQTVFYEQIKKTRMSKILMLCQKELDPE